jgi:diguanylate cyclase (GGDEF)-like protein/PAS domain S-box-containing protein
VESAAPTFVSRVRVVITLLATILVVAGEFALLTVIYQRGEPTRNQHQIVATLAGEWRAAPVPAPAAVLSDTDAAIAKLRGLHLAGRELAALTAAVAEARTDPGTAASARLSGQVTELDHRLATDQRRIDDQAEIIYAVVLITVSIAWMLWFRRLVARHRSLQRDLSSSEAQAVGERRLAALVRSAADVVLVSDLDGAISFVTPSIQAVLGRDPDELVHSRWLDLVDSADHEQLLRLVASSRPGADSAVRARMRHADGRLLHVSGTLTNLVDDPAVNGLVLTVRDVTEQVQLETELTHQAFHDALTGIANRQLFTDRLAHALEQRPGDDPSKRALVVLFCDLDEFKQVNDSLGHAVGDLVLIEVAKRATSITRRGDTVARLGGDEFAILMENTDLRVAEEVAGRLQTVLREPMTVDGQTLVVKASVGLASAIPGDLSGDEALRNADVAMYLAKDRGKATIAVYEPQLHAEALDRLALRNDLQDAIRSGQLTLHYQPTVELGTGRLAGFEALVRWTHPTRGQLSPIEFIPLAEQTGLINALGSWVLRTACVAAVEFGDCTPSGGRPPTVAVNVTAQQLSRIDFVTEVLDALAEVNLAPQRLTVEITESVLMRDLDAVVGRLAALREHGIRIAIDDFGTGYSSLAYLRRLPLDILKIDKAFVDRITTDEHDAALAEAILAMSTAMELATVAEGVETLEQAQWLTAANCVYGQGYLWSRPVPLEQARALVVDTADGRWAATGWPPVNADLGELGELVG